uniref:CRP-I 15 n=1 Tax=Mytilus galloprovincialis TaxID=29158 RepID=A0A0A7ACU5_MYTGA|nr:CRP-I 15 [Mytilus galloprovincialis]
MKFALCLVACVMLVFVGVNMANGEILEDNGFLQKLEKRAVSCGTYRKSCSFRKCCSGYTCSYGRCRSSYGK